MARTGKETAPPENDLGGLLPLAETRSPKPSPQECHSSHFPQRLLVQNVCLGKTGKERHLPSQGVGRS